MATANKFLSFTEHLAEGVHNLQTGVIKAMLTNSAPVNTNTVKADLTEISAGNGYTAGGVTLALTSSSLVSGVYRLIMVDGAITASGGSIGPFRYVAIYNDTPTSPADPLIQWYDYGSSITLLDGEPLNLDLDGTNGLLSIV